jgi:hypothetical protein
MASPPPRAPELHAGFDDADNGDLVVPIAERDLFRGELWQHCNPANRFGRRDRHEFADVRFWVSPGIVLVLAICLRQRQLPPALSNLTTFCRSACSVAARRFIWDLSVNCYLTVFTLPGLKRLLKYLGEHLSGFRGDLPHAVVKGRRHLRGEMHCAAGAA